MSDLVRDAPIGQIIRWVTKNKVLQYPEEKPDFQSLACYTQLDETLDRAISSQQKTQVGTPTELTGDIRQRCRGTSEDSIDLGNAELERAETEPDLERNLSQDSQITRVTTLAAMSHAHTQADLEQALLPATFAEHDRPKSIAISPARLDDGTILVDWYTTDDDANPQNWSSGKKIFDLEQALLPATFAEHDQTKSIVIAPTRLDDGTILVDWYTTDDDANPQNWSSGKKIFVSLPIYIYSLAVYMGSAIYAPSESGVMEQFGVSATAAELGLALYVLAYGIGPLIFSPLSEIPRIGRNLPYVITFALFVILTIPTALVNNFAGLLVLRFLLGFFGSPCLATGAASLQDMYSFIKLPYVISIWSLCATCGPALGPIISGFSVSAENWRWSLWDMLWMAGPIWIVMFLFLPETSSPNILLCRAKRLRKASGSAHIKSQSEIDQANLNAKDVAFEALYRPFQLIILDPSVAFAAVYLSSCYGIYYSFFEVFPLVYIKLYQFNLGEMGLAFLSIIAALVIDVAIYYAYVYYVVEPEILNRGLGAPERRLIPALFAAFCCPVGLFVFAWTANGHTHWIASVIGATIFVVGAWLIMQCILIYLPLSYPQYTASLLAGNGFVRSIFAAATILFSRPMYINMGIGPATSMLGAFTAVCILGVFVLFFYGEKLRARSKFAAS